MGGERKNKVNGWLLLRQEAWCLLRREKTLIGRWKMLRDGARGKRGPGEAEGCEALSRTDKLDGLVPDNFMVSCRYFYGSSMAGE